MSFLVIPKNVLLIEEPWFFIVAFFLAVIIPIFYRKRKYPSNTSALPLDAIPGPTSIPLLGNFVFWNVNPDTCTKTFLLDYVKEYGPINRFVIANHQIVCLSSPELLEPVLKSTTHVNKSLLYSLLKPWIGTSFFFLPDLIWKIRRRIVVSLSISKNKTINSFIGIFNESSENCSRAMEKVLTSQEKVEIDIAPFINRWALDNACETIIGRHTMNEGEKSLYFKNFKRINEIIVKRGIRPWFVIDKLFERSTMCIEMNKCVKSNRDLLKKLLKDTRTKSKLGKDKQCQCPFKPNGSSGQYVNNTITVNSCSFLEEAINAAESGAADCWNQDEQLISDIEGSMFAAYDTVTSALTWFLYCIAKHPKQQKLLADELNLVFGDSERECTLEDVAKLNYTECCIKESMRLYPSTPFISRTISEDIEIGGYLLPAGISVLVNIYGVHRSPSQYSNPEVYLPERFLPENSIGRHRFAFLPFSAGPRNCIGQKYAWLEMKVFVSTLLRRFQFSLVNEDDLSKPMLEPSYAIMLKPKDGLRLVVSKRPPTELPLP